MRILVFLHGTVIMHPNAAGRPRHERVQQVIDGEKSVRDFASYVPVDNAVRKLQAWSEQGAQILYITFHKAVKDVEQDESVLRRHGFPEGEILYRRHGEEYKDVAERIMPDVLIEDDCESVGGEVHMTYPHIKAALQAKIKSVVVREFGGIGHLPDSIVELKS